MLEHVPPELEPIVLDNIARACAGNLIASWAVRGQGGDGHANCRDNPDAIARIEARGFRYLPEPSESARTMDHGECFHFRQTVLVFERA